MNHPRFSHQTRIQLGRCSCGNPGIVTGKVVLAPATWGSICRTCSPPQMIRSVRDEVCHMSTGENRRPATVPLREYYLIKQCHSRILGLRVHSFTLTDELIESLRLLQHSNILGVFMWQTLQEGIHVEAVGQSGLLLVATG